MDTQAFRKKVRTDVEMTPEQFVSYVSSTLPGGVLNPEMMDFLEMYNQEMRKDIAYYTSKIGFLRRRKRWMETSAVVRAYERWREGERPE